jgi:RimJ/RimL family protein N-acetyltransferase
LVIRDIVDADRAQLLGYLNEAASLPNVLRRDRDPAVSDRFLRIMSRYNDKVPWHDRECFALSVCAKGANTLIGSVNFQFMDSRSMRIGWHFGTAHSGLGYATEATRGLIQLAFGEFGLSRVYGDCFASNPAAISVFRKSGVRPVANGWGRNWLRGLAYREFRPIVRYSIEKG